MSKTFFWGKVCLRFFIQALSLFYLKKNGELYCISLHFFSGFHKIDIKQLCMYLCMYFRVAGPGIPAWGCVSARYLPTPPAHALTLYGFSDRSITPGVWYGGLPILTPWLFLDTVCDVGA